MTVKELLNKLGSEEVTLRKQVDDSYDKCTEIKKRIKEYYENPCVAPNDIPHKLLDEYVYWNNKYSSECTQWRHVINIIVGIKERVLVE